MSGDNAGVPGTMIRVAVVDDHELVRSGICNALSMSPDIKVIGEAGDGLAALELLERQPADILVLDLNMPRMDGFTCLDNVRRRWPGLPVIILTVDEDPEVAVEVLRRGAAAYVPKFVRPSDLGALVRQVAGGSILVGGNRLAGVIGSPDKPAVQPPPAYGLTNREVEVLTLVARGKSNSDIAAALFITTKTVKYHLTTIFNKLGVKNRTEAAAFALGKRLVSTQDPGPATFQPH